MNLQEEPMTTLMGGQQTSPASVIEQESLSESQLAKGVMMGYKAMEASMRATLERKLITSQQLLKVPTKT